jgi:hypothetical protein
VYEVDAVRWTLEVDRVAQFAFASARRAVSRWTTSGSRT